jgi:cell division inhibitor SepF
MALRDTWRRSLEYFGLVEGDYIEEGEYADEGDTGTEPALDETAVSPRGEAPRSRTARRGRSEDIDDIFAEDEAPPRRRGRLRAVESRREPAPGDNYEPAPVRRGNGGEFAMHVVTPRSFNDAQQVADEFKRSKPVIVNLQSTDRELSKRLIDFSSGMTYALGGGMQRISQGIFLLTPQNVEVSAEEKARILEGGFFNQS